MPSWRNSEVSRKAKSAAQAAHFRERLGIPEWNAPQADPHQHEEALHHEVVTGANRTRNPVLTRDPGGGSPDSPNRRAAGRRFNAGTASSRGRRR